MFCENCGSKIPDESAFCEECGTKIESSTSASIQNNTTKTYAPKKKPVGLIIGMIVVISAGGFFGIKMLNEKNNPTSGDNVFPSVSDGAAFPEILDASEKPKETSANTQKPENNYKDYRGYEEGENASIGDFFWFTEDIKWEGLLPEGRTVIKDFDTISGYWKAYTETIPMFLDEEEYKEWFNVEISGNANKATFTFHTKGFTGFDAQTGESYDISMKDGEKHNGNFSGGELVVGDIETKGVEITIMQFYSFNGKQYALGEIEYISNEKQNIVLVRP